MAISTHAIAGNEAARNAHASKADVAELKADLKELEADLKNELASKEDLARLEGALKEGLARLEGGLVSKADLFKLAFPVVGIASAAYFGAGCSAFPALPGQPKRRGLGS